MNFLRFSFYLHILNVSLVYSYIYQLPHTLLLRLRLVNCLHSTVQLSAGSAKYSAESEDTECNIHSCEAGGYWLGMHSVLYTEI